MMKVSMGCFFAAFMLTGCVQKASTYSDHLLNTKPRSSWLKSPQPQVARNKQPTRPIIYHDYIRQAAMQYNIDEKLIKAIIQVESGFNPNAISRSNAVGLMQLKAATAGRDAYRMKGKKGQPSAYELKNPAVNIDLGTAYLNVIQNQMLSGITNPRTLQYATIVSYVNGAGAMLRTFASDRRVALNRINQMSPEEFYQHIQQNHPAPQAPRYLWKVTTAYQSFED